MNKREKILISIISVILIILTITSISLYNLKNRTSFLQEQIDYIFIYSLRIAISAYSGVDENGFASENDEEDFYKNAYLCSNLHGLTSYSNNKVFTDIVALLSNTFPLHGIPKLSNKLIECILRYISHPCEYAELESEITEGIQEIFDTYW